MITADGELQASAKLAEAAAVMSQTPAALQLRLLETVVEVAAEKNSTLVLPFPVELLRFLENATSSATTPAPAASATPGSAPTTTVAAPSLPAGPGMNAVDQQHGPIPDAARTLVPA